MKKLICALLCVLFLCGCAVQTPTEPAEPQWREAYRDDGAVICALPASSAEGCTTLSLTVSCLGGENIVLSSLLCFDVRDEYGSPVRLSSAQGLDGIVRPGETVTGEIVLVRENLDGCVVSVALDYAAGRWVALNLI